MNVISSNTHMEMAHSTHPANAPADSSAVPKKIRDISQPVKDYVVRAFQAEGRYPGITTDELSAKLNVVITERLSNGLEFTTDWTTWILPQELIMQERLRAAPHPVFSPWLIQPQPLPASLPPHLPPPPPPPTNMMSATHTNLFAPAARQGPLEEQHERASKRRYHEDRDPSPHKKLRAQSPVRRSRNNDDRDTWDRYNGTRSPDWTPSPPTDKYERTLDERTSKLQNKRKNEEDRKYGQRQPERRKQEGKQSKREGAEHAKPKKQKQTEFDKRQREEEVIKRKERLMRFAASKPPIQTKPNAPANPYGRLVGINTDLEKDYYRLTSDPKPELVRPQAVLEKSLVLVKEKWDDEHKYNYVRSQLKSIRQDLVVQHIKNPFTIEVYQTHARIALVMSDLGEYNQCQTQLYTLHKGMRKRLSTEFIAYRILYFVLTKNGPAMNDTMLEMSDNERKDAAVKNALAIRNAIALGNYYRFFQLCNDIPNLGGYLVQSFITRQRLTALANYAKTFKYPPALKLNFFTNEMAFDTVGEGVQFFSECLSQAGDASLFFSESPDGEKAVLLNKAAAILRQAADTAARTIDIKGQI